MMIICFCSIMSVCQFVKSNEHLFYYNCFHVYVNFQPLCFHHAVPLETIEKYQMTFIQQPFVWTFICICCNVTQRCNAKVEQNWKTRWWFGRRLLVFVVVTNFEALCVPPQQHLPKSVRLRVLFFENEDQFEAALRPYSPHWKGSHEFVRERNSLLLLHRSIVSSLLGVVTTTNY